MSDSKINRYLDELVYRINRSLSKEINFNYLVREKGSG